MWEQAWSQRRSPVLCARIWRMTAFACQMTSPGIAIAWGMLTAPPVGAQENPAARAVAPRDRADARMESVRKALLQQAARAVNRDDEGLDFWFERIGDRVEAHPDPRVH